MVYLAAKVRNLKEQKLHNHGMPSSVIAKYYYKPERELLTIVYVSGAVYHYLDVPQAVFDAFREAYSKGNFLNKNIKPNFRYVKRD
ncbi:KTSC domain-containing protein [Chryseobacterium sp. 6424]|uniref:KTSC domain-containing protein n=1 Tax=Chryseobacterium sp. 6424 TaxID=2039166 RepID=UPI001E2C8941|nr:KTSC domain-containing protein [Chryseobacterium sp. 6424]